MIAKETILEKALDKIEEEETRLIAWGIVDTFITRNELIKLLDDLINSFETEELQLSGIQEIINLLLEKNLIIKTTQNQNDCFRSRMSETIRLLFHVRQMFPKKHGSINGWQSAPTLVSDYRFLRRKRFYPKRNINKTDAIERISTSIIDTNLKKAIENFIIEKDANIPKEFNLSEFQIRASKRILEGLIKKEYYGTLISAGTGSGKTLAFYIPALSKISSNIIERGFNESFLQCLSIYPKNELLKDQFSEIFKEARLFDKFLNSRNKRKIIIAPLFSDVPRNTSWLLNNFEGKQFWKEKNNGYICPFLTCFRDGCDGHLIWSKENLENKKEVLECEKCDAIIHEDEIILTRDRMQETPPDILFTSTEMLNQNLSNHNMAKLFGIKFEAKQPPIMVLLDEIHTYSGTHGAQVGFLLRRWINRITNPISVVGLSATIKDPERFFNRLTGIFENNVEEIKPAYKDMESQGAEYIIALKGDPVSQTSLLSTTIQTSMLLSRMIENLNVNNNNKFYGKKVFAFTDDIDVTNRLYFGLLDAEGKNFDGSINNFKKPLSSLRIPKMSISRERYGQNWSAPEDIGHNLNLGKIVERVSSQDKGIDKTSEIVVATSSLEVGFNDPEVGVVIQHKSPRDYASFLQRKGRAGRTREMRPWTSIIMSDYGRDKVTYQAYEQLFDPEISTQPIPLESRYIQHIQAVYSLFEFISKEKISYNSWKALAKPIKDLSKNSRQYQIKLRDFLISILEEPNVTDKLKNHIFYALGFKYLNLNENDINRILWDHPRPLLTTVIPTAIRRLDTNWENEIDDAIDNSPLPEFIPPALFSELNLPEVQIILPNQNQDFNNRPIFMPIAQALKTYAPGRVSRRYGISSGKIRHWISNDEILNQETNSIQHDKFYQSSFQGDWDYIENNNIKKVKVYRPFSIKPIQTSTIYGDTSNAFLKWNTQIVKKRAGEIFDPPSNIPKNISITGIQLFSHSNENPIEVRRFALRSDADIKLTNGENFRTQIKFYSEDENIGIGYSMNVDGIRFIFDYPKYILEKNFKNKSNLLNSLKVANFIDTIIDNEFDGLVTNPFMCEWLANIYYTALIIEASENESSFEEANKILNTNDGKVDFEIILNTIFQTSIENDQNIDNDDLNNENILKPDKLAEELTKLLKRSDIINVLKEKAELFWNFTDLVNLNWIKEKYKSTIASSVYNLLHRLCPDLNINDLILDIDSGPLSNEDCENEKKDEFWISEVSPGGTGIIEKIINTFSEDPRRFGYQLKSVISKNEYEYSNNQLSDFLDDINDNNNSSLVTSVNKYRLSSGIKDKENSFNELRNEMIDKGYILYHGFLTSLNNRILKIGTSDVTDEYLKKVFDYWTEMENFLGIEIDPKIIAYKFSKDEDLDNIVIDLGYQLPDHNLENWRYNIVYGFLWPKGSIIRNQHLEVYNQFCKFLKPERLLLDMELEEINTKINALDQDNIWKKETIKELSKKGFSTIVCPYNNKDLIQEIINFFIITPIETDYVISYARLIGLKRFSKNIEIDFELVEAKS